MQVLLRVAEGVGRWRCRHTHRGVVGFRYGRTYTCGECGRVWETPFLSNPCRVTIDGRFVSSVPGWQWGQVGVLAWAVVAAFAMGALFGVGLVAGLWGSVKGIQWRLRK